MELFPWALDAPLVAGAEFELGPIFFAPLEGAVVPLGGAVAALDPCDDELGVVDALEWAAMAMELAPSSEEAFAELVVVAVEGVTLSFEVFCCCCCCWAAGTKGAASALVLVVVVVVTVVAGGEG